MTEIKPALEIFSSVLKENNVDNIKLEDEFCIFEYVEIAMQSYVEQFIDLAAESATTFQDTYDLDTADGSFEYFTNVDKESILKLKKQIK